MGKLPIIAMILFVALLGLSAVFYTFQRCGMKALILGNGALVAAATGMCE